MLQTQTTGQHDHPRNTDGRHPQGTVKNCGSLGQARGETRGFSRRHLGRKRPVNWCDLTSGEPLTFGAWTLSCGRSSRAPRDQVRHPADRRLGDFRRRRSCSVGRHDRCHHPQPPWPSGGLRGRRPQCGRPRSSVFGAAGDVGAAPAERLGFSRGTRETRANVQGLVRRFQPAGSGAGGASNNIGQFRQTRIDMGGAGACRRHRGGNQTSSRMVDEWPLPGTATRSSCSRGGARLLKTSANANGHPSFVMSNSFTNQCESPRSSLRQGRRRKARWRSTAAQRQPGRNEGVGPPPTSNGAGVWSSPSSSPSRGPAYIGVRSEGGPTRGEPVPLLGSSTPRQESGGER